MLAIGGLPPDVKTTGSWAITPVVSDFADEVIRYWTIIPDGFTIKSKESVFPQTVLLSYLQANRLWKRNPQGKFVAWTEQAGYIPGLRRLQVDSGTWGVILPTAYVDEIYKSIDPPPYNVKGKGSVANCNVCVKFRRTKGGKVLIQSPGILCRCEYTNRRCRYFFRPLHGDNGTGRRRTWTESVLCWYIRKQRHPWNEFLQECCSGTWHD